MHLYLILRSYIQRTVAAVHWHPKTLDLLVQITHMSEQDLYYIKPSIKIYI